MRKLALIILDGWGLGENKPNNAIFKARTPFFDSLWETYPHTQLQASGEFVGLPAGQIGGSEVGHLTIGAGRVVYQQLPRITKELKAEPFSLQSYTEFIQKSRQFQPHLIGLVSDGGVHSHIDHLLRLLELMKKNGCKSPWIHVITDGRDTPPNSSTKYIKQLNKKIHELEFGKIATVSGRFYAMDRDKNWDRTKKTIDTLTCNHLAIEPFNRLEHETDEFIVPHIVDNNFKGIKPHDVAFFFNFRSDRMKQLVKKLDETVPDLSIVTMTQYDKSFTYPTLFDKQRVADTLGEILSKLGHTQVRAAESEKFAHVTYFFNGGVEVVFNKEIRSLAESNKVKHDEMPKMKAKEIHENVKQEVERNNPDFVLVNFANPDMVGHTGNFKAVVEGVESVDKELRSICTYLTSKGYICCITADHGNADIMYNLETNEPHTAHTLNPVPFIIYDPFTQKNQHVKLNRNPENGLHLIAGTVLDLMEIKNRPYDSLII